MLPAAVLPRWTISVRVFPAPSSPLGRATIHTMGRNSQETVARGSVHHKLVCTTTPYRSSPGAEPEEHQNEREWVSKCIPADAEPQRCVVTIFALPSLCQVRTAGRTEARWSEAIYPRSHTMIVTKLLPDPGCHPPRYRPHSTMLDLS